ncbi:MAG: amidohydrolase family protein [Pseudomonadales bacterium]|nr:amidohydrolase family protein [Pseudomonadales bacterium]
MHDLIIKGGNIVDGSGEPQFSGDIAIDNGVITEIGKITAKAAETIDADGLLVAPGWVDIHTHYDGQATWDPLVTPSGWNGVTTAIMGNCGVGFAPVAPDNRDWMIELMESVEDIPAATLKAGIDWQWEGFPGYLDALEKMPRAVNVGAYLGHCALRTYVMGARGAEDIDPNETEVAQMASIMSEAMQAGAMGFSTSRTGIHLTPEGDPIPGTFAKQKELMAIAKAIGDTGKGIIEVIPGGMPNVDRTTFSDEMALMKQLSIQSGRPLTYLSGISRKSFSMAEAANKEGAQLYPQISSRPVGMLFSFESENPFKRFPSFIELLTLSASERLARLRDPAVKARILADNDPALTNWSRMFSNPWKLTYVLGDKPNYEPDPKNTVLEIARREGRSPAEVGYDLMLENNGKAFLLYAATGYTEGNLDRIRESLLHPLSMLGGSDGGAHCGFIVDAGVPTFMLTHWARDRSYDRLPLEWVIQKQTRETARRNGIMNRGELKAGQQADINLIDMQRLQILAPEVVQDLPANGARLMQKADGYMATLVSGKVIQKNGVDTGARPGGVIRS